MPLDQDHLLPPETQVKRSPAFPAPTSQSEQPQLVKPRPPIQTKNGFQSPAGIPPPAPPTPAQRAGKRRFSVGVAFRGVAKRRRRANSENQREPELPSHFLLGGNIFDPLNLNSLLDEDVNRITNEETPKCSPLPTRGRDPVEILVPRDITDPLNLTEEVLPSPPKARRRHRHHGGGAGGGDKDREEVPARLFPSAAGVAVPGLASEGSVSASPLSCELNTDITCRDDVAPPPLLPRRHAHPPPGSTQTPGNKVNGRHRRRRRTTSTRSADVVPTATAVPTRFQTPVVGGTKATRCGGPRLSSAHSPEKKKDRRRYQFGNHSRYYGYHSSYGDCCEGRVGAEDDPRLRLLEADWFRDKTVLDVGCGSGHVTLAIARRFNPTHILGVELDRKLVHAAKQNIRHFLSHDVVMQRRAGLKGRQREEVQLRPFPRSFRVSWGPLSAPPLLPPPSSSSRFPNNITFIQGDYVSHEEAWPGQGDYDVILCLGVTKWVQLQSGDGGVARLFRRAYQSLRGGGVLVLEAQPWSSYGRSKRASETTLRHYRTVRLRPQQFTCFLTDSVGFSSYRLLQTGGRRPVYLFHKGPAHRR